MSHAYPMIEALPVIMEDDSVLVVNKPSGMLSQPGKHEDGSVLTRVVNSGRQMHGPVLVHRLDMDTSGLLVLAKTRDVHRCLQQQFEKRLVKKRYRAQLESAPLACGGRIGLPIRLDVEDRPRQIVCHEQGKPSTTLWHRSPGTNSCAVTFYPLTGRTHQLRVHAAAQQGLGIAIVGDRLYGSNSTLRQNSSASWSVLSDRLMLHADLIQFKHPVTGLVQRVTCPAPF